MTNGLIVSNPISIARLVQSARATSAEGALGEAVYVSLSPGTVPNGNQAILRRVGAASSVATMVSGGGFDPVPVTAQAGDSLDVTVVSSGGDTLYQQRVLVLASRPPVVVRTEPPPKKRDVPLNANIVVVFSEPVNGGTINSSSVQLRHGSAPIAGSVGLLQGAATTAVFTPAAPLDPNGDYQLTVTQAVQDLQGGPLAAADTVDFTTGSTTVGTVASVSLGLNDTATVVPLGSQFQLAATA
ncbi:MAG TPA: Ig-like domain-containing protein, partial [Gemmatimonadales bacterium]|nr:Ig-like domain-containing protein [Gemmatimonadales bacterium]